MTQLDLTGAVADPAAVAVAVKRYNSYPLCPHCGDVMIIAEGQPLAVRCVDCGAVLELQHS